MTTLNYLEKIPLQSGGECEVIDYVSEGGQGYIYATTNRRMLKWYKEEFKSGPLKKNIEQLARVKTPYPNLTWPLMMTQDYKGSFGYLMNRIPSGYVPLSYFIFDDEYNLNVEEILQVGYAIAASFNAIHQQGYVYQDINPGGIFVNKQLKSVIICDLDNCNKDGKEFVVGTPMYMAPELVTKMANVSLATDYYSLAVILFRLFYINHPLEGKKTWSKPMNVQDEIEYFGKNPVFVLDPVDHSNGFYQDCTLALEKRWHWFPQILKDTFIKAFTTGLKNPKRRINDEMWMEVIKQCYDCFVKKKFDTQIKEGFFSLETISYLKININGQKTLISDYKKIYGYIFDRSEIFTTVLFESYENNIITIYNNTVIINNKRMQKGDKLVLKRGDIIEYRQIKGIVE